MKVNKDVNVTTISATAQSCRLVHYNAMEINKDINITTISVAVQSYRLQIIDSLMGHGRHKGKNVPISNFIKFIIIITTCA